MTKRDRIRTKAVEIQAALPHGIRYSELMAKIQQALPDAGKNNVSGSIWNLEVVLPDQVYKPA